jgi:hypothetical protein
MSGGVDSSVTAKLMVDQVCCFEPKLFVGFLLSGFAGSRVMVSPDCSYETGIQETNPGSIKDANGKRIGKTYGWCPNTWVYPAELCVHDDATRALRYVHRGASNGGSHQGVLERRIPPFVTSTGSRQYPEPRCVVSQVSVMHNETRD